MEDGSAVILEDAHRWISKEAVDSIIEQQREEIERRKAVLRRSDPLPDIAGRTMILVDDGIAMGSTMRAAIKLCKHQGAERIVVAVPVAGSKVKAEIGELVDEIVVLETPRYFRAVAQVYEHWYDVPDTEGLAIIEKWRNTRQKEEKK